ncbi:MAG: hypothetical protein ACO1OB_17695 [Archangium sp.]
MLALTTLLLTISGDVNVHSARLLDEPPVFAQVEEAPLPRTSIPQLEVDIRALERMKASFGLVGLCFGLGGGVGLAGGLFLFVAAISSAPEAILIAGATMAGIGVGLIAIGVWVLIERINERTRINDTVRELKQQLAEQRRGGYSLELPVRTPMTTVATF